MDILKTLAAELNIKVSQAKAAVELIDEGNTIPFIARYRKEATGSLDDSVLRDLFDRLTYLRNLEKRREEVRSSIEEQGKLTEELAAALAAAETLARIEDLYLPYKKKRRTRAGIARERGLEPLAATLLEQNPKADPVELAAAYVDEEKEVPDAAAALAGARDILAEDFSDNADLRGRLRGFMAAEGVVASAGDEKTDPNGVFEMYRDFAEPVKKLAPHRVLALNRGEKEKALKVGVQLDAERALGLMLHDVKKNDSPCAAQVAEAAADSWKRLIFPSLENEQMNGLFEVASEQAIKVFALNLGHLLMQPPVKDQVVLGLDPAYRTGCKIAVVDATGRVLDTAVVYPTPPQKKIAEAKAKLTQRIKKHGVTVISSGNGTASRE
ncbi:MAG: RNA-binding transcriptional accessory protein, partial [Oscillospiraceae bacterium]|nr:RNA-binding transcriptional accessory protein [Oscillospiraceae bacterium]